MPGQRDQSNISQQFWSKKNSATDNPFSAFGNPTGGKTEGTAPELGFKRDKAGNLMLPPNARKVLDNVTRTLISSDIDPKDAKEYAEEALTSAYDDGRPITEDHLIHVLGLVFGGRSQLQ